MAFAFSLGENVAALVAGGLAVAGLAIFQNQKPKLCSQCQGQGGFKCFVCDGKGKVQVGKTTSRKFEKCKGCLGRGKMLCRKCSGSGYSRNYIG
mmetsp:Transcript_11038/g.33855  ORF Transcript_11038/g.33855 Transcript_11038/m.33855 type:complete len:94 (-) Transcript_11038:116-397(-)